MALKKFIELTQLDISSYVQKKPTFFKDGNGKSQKTSEDKWLDYIEWAKVLELLYLSGAEKVATYSEMHPNKPNTLIIKLSIDGDEYKTDYPIIDGNQIISMPNQMQIHKAELRGFVKCVAIHTGLGLSLWQKEEQITGDVITETMPIKLNAKKLLMSAESVAELTRIWQAMSENEQVKFKDIFTQQKEMLQ